MRAGTQKGDDETMAETETVAKYIAELDYSSIPQKILEEMKVLLFDYLGVALGGTRTESGRIAVQFFQKLREKGEATIIGFGYRVSARVRPLECDPLSQH